MPKNSPKSNAKFKKQALISENLVRLGIVNSKSDTSCLKSTKLKQTYINFVRQKYVGTCSNLDIKSSIFSNMNCPGIGQIQEEEDITRPLSFRSQMKESGMYEQSSTSNLDSREMPAMVQNLDLKNKAVQILMNNDDNDKPVVFSINDKGKDSSTGDIKEVSSARTNRRGDILRRIDKIKDKHKEIRRQKKRTGEVKSSLENDILQPGITSFYKSDKDREATQGSGFKISIGVNHSETSFGGLITNGLN